MEKYCLGIDETVSIKVPRLLNQPPMSLYPSICTIEQAKTMGMLTLNDRSWEEK